MNKIISTIKEDWDIIVGVLTAFVIAILDIIAVTLLIPHYGLIKSIVVTNAILVPLSFMWVNILYIQWAISDWLDRKKAQRRR